MGALFVVATPIGNLSELSPRAAETLRDADLILAEDTRVTMKLLSHLEIRVPLQSNHRHNEREQAAALVRRIVHEDLTVALVSDAGTPGVSDPGAALVSEAAAAGIPVYPVAGPSAVAAALSICGFEGTGYAFHGFAPRSGADRERALQDIAMDRQRIAVLFESPHRACGLVEDIARILPDARLCVCRDLTKRFELTLRGSPDEVIKAMREHDNGSRGEYVLVLYTPEQKVEITPILSARAIIADALIGGASHKEALALATESGVARNDAYRALLEVKEWLQNTAAPSPRSP